MEKSVCNTLRIHKSVEQFFFRAVEIQLFSTGKIHLEIKYISFVKLVTWDILTT